VRSKVKLITTDEQLKALFDELGRSA
jgi:hypothetical protein